MPSHNNEVHKMQNKDNSQLTTYRLDTHRLQLSSIEVICAPSQFLKVHVFAAISTSHAQSQDLRKR